MVVGQGPAVSSVGAGVLFDQFSLVYHFSILSPSYERQSDID